MALEHDQRRGGRGWHAVTQGHQAVEPARLGTGAGTSHKKLPQYVSSSGSAAIYLQPRSSDEFPRMGGPVSHAPSQPQRSQAAVAAQPRGTAARQCMSSVSSQWQQSATDRGTYAAHVEPQGSLGPDSRKELAHEQAAGAALAESLRGVHLSGRDLEEDWQDAAAAQLSTVYSWAGKRHQQPFHWKVGWVHK